MKRWQRFRRVSWWAGWGAWALAGVLIVMYAASYWSDKGLRITPQLGPSQTFRHVLWLRMGVDRGTLTTWYWFAPIDAATIQYPNSISDESIGQGEVETNLKVSATQIAPTHSHYEAAAIDLHVLRSPAASLVVVKLPMLYLVLLVVLAVGVGTVGRRHKRRQIAATSAQ